MHKYEIEHLMEHWIEHNKSHSKSFRERAKDIEAINPRAAEKVREAADLMDLCTRKLEEAAGEL